MITICGNIAQKTITKYKAYLTVWLLGEVHENYGILINSCRVKHASLSLYTCIPLWAHAMPYITTLSNNYLNNLNVVSSIKIYTLVWCFTSARVTNSDPRHTSNVLVPAHATRGSVAPAVPGPNHVITVHFVKEPSSTSLLALNLYKLALQLKHYMKQQIQLISVWYINYCKLLVSTVWKFKIHSLYDIRQLTSTKSYPSTLQNYYQLMQLMSNSYLCLGNSIFVY